MVYHWQSHNVKRCGVDDMVLLPAATEDAIVDNLRKRYMDDYIFTSIGPVLISVNPFKQMPYFGEKEIELYQGAASYENPPHIYGLADEMFRNLLVDNESQCVIISGESGAGKTVAARYIMGYIARVSGGSTRVQHVKDVVLGSNPLLEAFGNAKTVRNNNSSRFGKYVEIVFDAAGQPEGGRISNFLLEKSRVTNTSRGERNFHVFYQLCAGAQAGLKDDLGIIGPESFEYLSAGGAYTVDGISDTKDFGEVQAAMRTMNFSAGEQRDIWNVVAAVLHIGNIFFHETGNYASVSDKAALEWPGYLLSIDKDLLESKLISRRFDSKWGAQEDSINVTLNVEQASYTRDALAKGIYAKLFDCLVQRVNAAMFTDKRGNNVGILDIYGFEILDMNGFEQFCINFVNEKLQQIFIQLTLKAEQEEYVAENIAWTPISFFNNQVVCELMEGRNPPGLFLVLDDVCATLHAVSEGADQDLHKKLNGSACASTHKHYQATAAGFVVQHYAGTVGYSVRGFCERNRDALFSDLVQMLQTSSNSFVRGLFPELQESKGRPTTAGAKIRAQAGELVARLMRCAPHYVRCVKPNESKRARDWDELRVKHQVEYLGLRENITVRRAGFAYRRPFSKFLHRYAIVTPQSWPRWRGDERDGVRHILKVAGVQEYQLGKTKVFIKNPESLFHLEELREQQYDGHARVIQKAFKQHFARKQQELQRREAAALVFGKKERRRHSINRHFVGDYIGISHKPDLQKLIGRRERVMFAVTVSKLDRRFKRSPRDLVLTSRSLLLVGMEAAPGSGGGKNAPLQPVVKRNIPFPNIKHVTLSNLQDDFVVLHVKDDYDSLLEVPFKTEFISSLSKKYLSQTARPLNIHFSNSVEFQVKKTGLGGGGIKQVVFVPTITGTDVASLRVNGNTLTVGIGSGLPADTQISTKRRFIAQRVNGVKKSVGNSGYPGPPAPAPPAPSRAAPPPPGPAPGQPRGIAIRPLPAQQAASAVPAPAPAKTQNRVPVVLGSPPPLPGRPEAHAPAPSQHAPSRNGVHPSANQPPIKAVSPPQPHIQRIQPAAASGAAPGTFRLPPPFQRNNATVTPPHEVQTTPPLRISSPKARNEHTPPRVNGVAPTNGKAGNHQEPIDFNQDLTNTLRRIRSKNQPQQPQPANSNGLPKAQVNEKPIPGGGRPRPQMKPKPVAKLVKALYDYQAQDVDEIAFVEGEIIELVKEHDGGWWQGRLKGKEGLFPSNYVQKM